REFGPRGRPAVCGHPEVEMALAELSRATGEKRYLETARLLIDRRGTGTLRTHPFGQDYFQDDIPVRQATTMRGHAVRALYLAAGALDVATESGDAGLAAAVREQWANGVARRTYITGGMGSHHQDEAFGDDFELPPDRAYAETCAGIASVMLSWRLLLATGQDKYADLIERTLLNNVLASPRADGRAFYYANTLHQRSRGPVPDEHQVSPRAESGLRSPWFEVSCCPTNVARTLASVGLYFATASDDGIQLHQYGSCRLSTELPAGPVTLEVASDYPADGTVRLTVVQAPSRTPLTLRLRVPEWAHGGCEASEPPAVRETTFLEFRRVFYPGDELRVTFPLRTRTVYPDARIDAVRGTFAVERGPLVLALESPDLPPGWDVNDLTADPASISTDETGASIDVYRHRAGHGGWPYQAGPEQPGGEPARARLIAYHEWANRGPATMRTWLPLAASPSV
ncbi:MAG TPA: beta-L-arabinofuranosidase domain-containing protein, partial [Trebonia sp.]